MLKDIRSTWLPLLLLAILIAFLPACAQTGEIPASSAPTDLPVSEAVAAIAPTAVFPVPEIANPGFEELTPEGLLRGWQSTGDVGAAQVDDKSSNSGTYRLLHKTAESYIVETSQEVTGLADGWYTLSAWVRSSGKNEPYLALRCGGQEQRVYVPSTTPGYRWIRLVVSNQARGGACTVVLRTFGTADSWASFDDIALDPGRVTLPILGADISSLNKSEDFGGIYKYADGTRADALEILRANGMNYARLRIWVNPADGYHDKDEILEMAQRIHAQGMKLLVDFHYSDDWADPGKQYKPAAWKNLNFEQLKQALYDHTYDVCNSLAAQGTPADMVQVGNEINAGMLWPDGDYNHFANLGQLLTAGYQAVKAAYPETLVMLHIAEGGDNEMNRWWFDNITRQQVPYDLIGVSFYPIWHGSLAELQNNLNDLSARYDKDVVVAEFAYPFTVAEDDSFANIAGRNLAVPGYLYTPEGQRLMMRDVMAVIRGVNGGRGLGLFYWDATWTAVPGNGWNTQDPGSGNGWENQALFDYDDKALPALAEFLKP